ncbi:uncharacterized protein LOC113237594 [Hyposmocoma kahamanoa]|uniref:uncharacterized protein LOC113237594 n=1 Tax=Hyposmocoma kahamanoa TaxID=1477025 RepID=UPI000E6D628A|nr:uncharacterized protein LOC113237594 [Hyposmocoma kahamanoa]
MSKMGSHLMDTDLFLSGNEQWAKLEQEWGNPIDLETEDDRPTKIAPAYSTLDLKRTTFNSPYLFKKAKKKVGRQYSKKSATLDYKDFLKDLEENEPRELPLKQFYYISGQIISALSVDEICDRIDDIFRSIERLCSTTSTINKKKTLPERVQCSIDVSDLSFDDTIEGKEKCDSDDVDRYIDEAFDQLNATIDTINNMIEDNDINKMNQSNRESVTTLVRKFSSFLKSPVANKNPKRKRQCNDKFRDLAEFWKSKALE